MGYQVLARRWRPQTFSEVVGQEHVIKTLSSAVTQGKVAHAYLFSGVRGVGKTTVARILAKALNCLERQDGEPCNQCIVCQEIVEGRSVDVIEIDGASNTGVDDIRELREQVRYLPMRGKYKIYIIDEVHMLSHSAFNALLKTLEEPPPHLVFTFATTEVHKIPATILSRCQHFAFRRMSRAEIIRRLIEIAEQEKFELTERPAALLAKTAEGSMRDALSLLDQALAYGGGKVCEEALVVLLGRVSEERLLELSRALRSQDTEKVFHILRQIIEQGYDLRQFCIDWMEHLRHLTVLKMVSQSDSEIIKHVDLAMDDLQDLRREAKTCDLDLLQRFFHLFSRTLEEVKSGVAPQLTIEMAFLKALRLPQLVPLEETIAKLEEMEMRWTGGQKAASIPAPFSRPSTVKEPLPSFPQSTGPTLSVSYWGELLRQIKEERPNLGSYLEQGVLLTMDKNRVRVGFPEHSAFLIPLVKKEDHLQFVHALLSSYSGQEVRLEVIPLPPEAAQNIKLAQEEKRKADLEVVHHPFVQETLRVFGGGVVEVREE